MDRARSSNTKRTKRRHAAARARVAAGVMSVAAFLGLGAAVAARSATTSAAADTSSVSSSAPRVATTTTQNGSLGSAVSGGFTTGQTPVTTSGGS